MVGVVLRISQNPPRYWHTTSFAAIHTENWILRPIFHWSSSQNCPELMLDSQNCPRIEIISTLLLREIMQPLIIPIDVHNYSRLCSKWQGRININKSLMPIQTFSLVSFSRLVCQICARCSLSEPQWHILGIHLSRSHHPLFKGEGILFNSLSLLPYLKETHSLYNISMCGCWTKKLHHC